MRAPNPTSRNCSGVFEGITTGAPIAVLVRNSDQRPADYDALRELYRPSHADYTYQRKFGIRDHRGGGRASARETLARVIAGAIARMILSEWTSIAVSAAVVELGGIESSNHDRFDSDRVYASAVRCDVPDDAERMIALLEQMRENGDSVGGIVGVHVEGMPAGLGEPIYDKLSARLAAAMISINGATGFEIGRVSPRPMRAVRRTTISSIAPVND